MASAKERRERYEAVRRAEVGGGAEEEASAHEKAKKRRRVTLGGVENVAPIGGAQISIRVPQRHTFPLPLPLSRFSAHTFFSAKLLKRAGRRWWSTSAPPQTFSAPPISPTPQHI